MKRISLLSAASAFLLLTAACGNGASTDKQTQKMADEAVASNEDKDLTGIFTGEGKSFSGKVSVQHFPATGQFSVLCQDDNDPNNSKLIQFVFKDEASARMTGSKKTAYDQGKDQTPGEVSVSYDVRFLSHDDAGGTFSVGKSGSNNELVFDHIALKTVTKESVTVSGKIPF